MKRTVTLSKSIDLTGLNIVGNILDLVIFRSLNAEMLSITLIYCSFTSKILRVLRVCLGMGICLLYVLYTFLMMNDWQMRQVVSDDDYCFPFPVVASVMAAGWGSLLTFPKTFCLSIYVDEGPRSKYWNSPLSPILNFSALRLMKTWFILFIIIN